MLFNAEGKDKSKFKNLLHKGIMFTPYFFGHCSLHVYYSAHFCLSGLLKLGGKRFPAQID